LKLGEGGKEFSYLPKSAIFTCLEWDDNEENIIGQKVTKTCLNISSKIVISQN